MLTYILLTAAEELMLLSRCEMEVLESSNRFGILWIYACTAAGFSLCSNPLLHLGLCNSAAVLHYKTGRADSIEFAGPPDDLPEHSIQDA
jgi:hypothetical protein